MSARVQVSMVTFDSDRYLRQCLDGLRRQTYTDFKLSIWDNASSDETLSILSENSEIIDTTHFSNSNLGFCAAHNRILCESGSDFVLVLNPDVVLDPEFLRIMVEALDSDPHAGSASGKLWRWQSDKSPCAGPFPEMGSEFILDTTGIYFTRNQRHLDRGSGEVDKGQYDRREYIFGVSGAAAFYRREMLESVRVGNEYFDESFFAYREDADLSWRAQWMGWGCLYVPEAHGMHVRKVLPERRAQLPAIINMHSFKNRFLLRLKNMDAGTYLRFFLPITIRDVTAIIYVLTRERSSLNGLPLLFRAIPKTWSIRQALRRHRRASPRDIRSWFSNEPAARPLRIP